MWTIITAVALAVPIFLALLACFLGWSVAYLERERERERRRRS